MYFIKIRNIKMKDQPTDIYLAADNITSVFFKGENTVLFTKDGGAFEIEGNWAADIVKAITAVTGGRVLNFCE